MTIGKKIFFLLMIVLLFPHFGYSEQMTYFDPIDKKIKSIPSTPPASDSVSGSVELATPAETVTGTDTEKAVTPAGIAAKMASPGEIGGTTPGPGNFTNVTMGSAALNFSIIAPNDLFAVGDSSTTTNIYFDSLLKEIGGTTLLNWNVAVSGTDFGTQNTDYWTFAPTDASEDGETITVSFYDTAGAQIDSHEFTLNVSASDSGGNMLESDPPDFDTAPVWTALRSSLSDQTITCTETGLVSVYRNVGMDQGQSYHFVLSGTSTATNGYVYVGSAGSPPTGSPEDLLTDNAFSIDATLLWDISNSSIAVRWYGAVSTDAITVTNFSAIPSFSILYIGDSTVAGHEIIDDLQAFDTGDTGVELVWIGTQDVGDENEGYSGKTVNWFYTDGDSPFDNEGSFDYANYLSSNGLSTPGVVIFQLGINDVFSQTTDSGVETIAASNIAQLEAMITAILAENPYTKIGIVLVFGPSTQEHMGTAYGSGQTQWRVRRNFQIYNAALIANTWNAAVTLLPANLNIDLANGMANGVHPDADGYQDIADTVWCWIKNMF